MTKLGTPSAIMLDLDDTIVAFDILTDKCWEETLNEFSDELKVVGAKEFKRAILKRSSWFWGDKERHKEWRKDLPRARRNIVGLVLKDYSIENESLANCIADRYSAIKDEMLYVFPGAKETIGKIRDAGVKLALVTNGGSKSQRGKIERFGLSDLFDSVLIEEEQKIGKPEAEVYRRALKYLNSSPEESWMVGDNLEWDVLSPQSIGIKGVWVNTKNEDLDPAVHPYLTVKSLPEIERYLF